jgi:phosphate acetyltransferase
MDLLYNLREKAKKFNKHIVLPEGNEDRTIKAADQTVAEGIAKITIIGNPSEILAKAKSFGLKNFDKINILNPLNHPLKDKYIELLYETRKNKGLTKDESAKLIENPLYLATLMIKNGDADGEVAGAENSTSNVLRPALQIIKTLPGISIVSGAFLMVLKDKTFGHDGVLLFADSGVNPDPNERELAEIAVVSAKTARSLTGMDPKVAMLSFSTKGSAKHPRVDKVINATRIAKEIDPALQIDGELQGDAALVPSVADKKAPGSKIAGKANVLIFPDLDSGNIAYKLVQRLAGATAIGPILQGIAAPVNDLSRGCSVQDIVDQIAITVNQAAG